MTIEHLAIWRKEIEKIIHDCAYAKADAKVKIKEATRIERETRTSPPRISAVELKRVIEELERLEKLNAALMAQIESVYNSNSWRITAPFRAFLRSLRGY
mgnify:CR=1 FL=1